jgi:2-dehydro-3-deoxygluconokinase
MSRFVTLGEIMLRLRAPGRERLLQSPQFEATFGGGEANVAVSLANFGLDAAFVSALPPNAIGDAVLAELRAFGVNTRHIIRSGERLGIYFLEAGANQRSASVIYDRKGSSFAEAATSDFDWTAIFAGADWFHITGITPALGESTATLAKAACREAKQRGLTISCDLSYRKSLWDYGRAAPAVMGEIFALVDVGIGGREDCQHALGIGATEPVSGASLEETYAALTQTVMERFPSLSTLALSLRESRTADHHGWTACLRNQDGFLMGPYYEIPAIVDRVGTGDSFAAGLIYGLNHYDRGTAALAFATAAGCLKHSISGDFNRVSVDEVRRLMAGETSGRVQR